VLIPVGALLIAIVSVQFGATQAKSLFAVIGAPGATALRLALAALMLGLALRPWRRPVPRPLIPALIGYGAALGCMNLLFYLSLRSVPLGVAVALEFLGPLAITLRALRRPIDAAWVALAAGGLAFLLPIGLSAHAVNARGAACALGAGGCWACYILFGRRIGPTMGTQASALGTLVAALIVVPIGLVCAGPHLFSPPTLARGAMVALFSSALPYTLEMIGLARLSPLVFGTLTSLEPAAGALIARAVLHQTLTATQWAAIAAIVAAAIGTTITDRPEPVRPEG
jgi:inner membrane transporter RhtA